MFIPALFALLYFLHFQLQSEDRNALQVRAHMEWLEMDARRQQAKLRRQQRELRRQQKEREAHERHLQLLARRCAEMQHEEQLSIAMAQLFASEAARQRLEAQREADMRVFRDTDKAQKRAHALGVVVFTPGLTGLSRLRELEARIERKELALQRAAAATQRLDALPATHASLKTLIVRFAASSLHQKVERAVLELRCERFEHLFDPVTQSMHGHLLDHESANGLTPVLATIVSRKLSVLRTLLERGATLNGETSWGMTPLLAAVMTDDVVAVSILSEFSVDLDYETAFCARAVHLAADKGRVRVLTALLRSAASVNARNRSGRSPLMQAVLSNQFEAIKVLLAFGADTHAIDPSGLTAFQQANALGFAHIASMLSSAVSSTSLYAQLIEEREEEAEEWNHGCGVVATSAGRASSLRRAVLMERAMADHDLPRLLQLLEDPSFSPNYEDRHGNTPFLVACEVGTCTDILYCLDKKAIPTHQNRVGRTGLMAACYRGDPDVLALLVNAGADLLTRDYRGWDAYRYLSYHEHPDVVAKLTKARRSGAALTPFKLREPLRSLEGLCPVKVPTPSSDRLVSSSIQTASDPDACSTLVVEHSDDATKLTEGNSANAEDDRASSSGRSVSLDSEDATTDPAIRKWHTRQDVLKNDRGRRAAFEHERELILKALKRGRRHGLVTPLPSDPAGRRKFPVCDNCTRCRARKRCAQCDQVLCDKCHARLHELAQRRHHESLEIEPEIYIGHELRDAVVERERSSLTHLVDASTELVASIRARLCGPANQLRPDALTPPSRHSEPEVARFDRAKRFAREQQVTQSPLNVLKATAKHAARVGDGHIFTNPVEMELAKLYIAQKKYEKATELLEQTKLLVSESLGALHPTMLQVAIGLAQIQQVWECVCVLWLLVVDSAHCRVESVMCRKRGVQTPVSRPCKAR